MAVTGSVTTWTAAAIVSVTAASFPTHYLRRATCRRLAIRMLRLGEEPGNYRCWHGRVAEFYEAKLQRSLDRIIGCRRAARHHRHKCSRRGLIVSVMTALLSVTQLVG